MKTDVTTVHHRRLRSEEIAAVEAMIERGHMRLTPDDVLVTPEDRELIRTMLGFTGVTRSKTPRPGGPVSTGDWCMKHACMRKPRADGHGHRCTKCEAEYMARKRAERKAAS